MIDKSDFRKAVGLVNSSEKILIITHRKPDGDACGCVIALSEALKQLGKKAQAVFLSQIPRWYLFLFESEPMVLGQDESPEELIGGTLGEPDLVIILDTNSLAQLPDFSEYLKENAKPVIVFDHHITGDGLGDIELTDSSSGATAVILFEFFKRADWRITEKMARSLFAAIAADTGWFRFSNADGTVFRICSELISSGAVPPQLYHMLYENFSPQRFELARIMLNSLELHFNGRYADQEIRQADFKKTGAGYADTESLIDECRRIKTVEAASLFVELADGRIRCSMRSSGGVDVCQIARKAGGGGHKKAAGAYLPGPLKSARQFILAEVEKQLE